MPARILFATESDHRRLRSLIATLQRMGPDQENSFKELSVLLKSANIVHSAEIPPDVITMNSTVRLKDLDDNENIYVTLVFPHKADSEAEKVSILSPIGTVLFGRRVGDSISGDLDGQFRRMVIEEVLYQPEADGEHSMDYSK